MTVPASPTVRCPPNLTLWHLACDEPGLTDLLLSCRLPGIGIQQKGLVVRMLKIESIRE